MPSLAGRGFFLALLVPLALLAGSSPARGQCAKPFDAAVTRMTLEGAALGNVWGCPTSGNTGSAPCGITYRYFTDDGSGTGAVNAQVDGNPIYVNDGGGSYRADIHNSRHYFGGVHPCGPPLYVLWDGVLAGGTGIHRGYYGAQSQIINFDEPGNIFLTNCGGTTRSVSCFAALAGDEALDVTGTPQGTLQHTGGMAPRAVRTTAPTPTTPAGRTATGTASAIPATTAPSPRTPPRRISTATASGTPAT